jgi:hypothetical protein
MRGSVRRRSAGSERVLAICEEIYARHRLRNGEAAQGLVKPFLFNMLNERSLDKNAARIATKAWKVVRCSR